MRLTIGGYKSFGASKTIRLAPMTVLSGANSSGKSTFMQPLLLLKQTLENDFDPDGLMIDGPNVRMTDSSQAASKVIGSSKKNLVIALDDRKNESDPHICSVSFKFKPGKGIQLASAKTTNPETGENFVLRPNQSKNSLLEFLKRTTFSKILETQGDKLKMEPRVVQERGLPSIGIFLKDRNIALPVSFKPASILEDLARELIHVPGLRGNPERSYKVAGTRNRFSGTFDKYVASIIHNWQLDDRKSKGSTLVRQLKELSLASAVKTQSQNDTRLEILVSRLKSGTGHPDDCVNIADVGFGVSQTLPVLVALLAADAGQTVYIEQPELHLHPRAQFKLARIFNEAVARGVRVVIETHSSVIIRGLQILIAKGDLNHKNVSLNWFSQNIDSGQSDISVADLAEDGSFGPWPVDFDDVIMEVEGAFLDALADRGSHGL